MISRLQRWRCLCGDTRPKHCANGKAAFDLAFGQVQTWLQVDNGFKLVGGGRVYFAQEAANDFSNPYIYWQVSSSYGKIWHFHISGKYLMIICMPSSLQAPLLGNHISYTVDVSNVGCHCNSAFYFVQMPGYDAGQVFVIITLSWWPASKFPPWLKQMI